MIGNILNYPYIIVITDSIGKINTLTRAAEKILNQYAEFKQEAFIQDFLEEDDLKFKIPVILRESGYYSTRIKFSKIKNIEFNLNCFSINNKEKNIFWLFSEISQTLHCMNDPENLCPRIMHQQKTDSIGLLTAGISHDMNNLFTAILGYSSLILEKNNIGVKTKSSLKQILNACRKASKITARLLEYQCQDKTQAEICDINDHTNDLLEMVTRIFCENIKITKKLGVFDEKVLIVKSELDQIIMNILINAGQAMPEGGEIVISTSKVTVDKGQTSYIPDSRQGCYILLSITDTGPGIADEVKSRIFEPYYSTKEENGGTGLGLSTSYSLMKKNLGWLNVYSEEDIGTTFKLYFPLAENIEMASKDAGNSEIDLFSGNGEHILLVEDAVEISDFVTQALEEYGYKVSLSENIASATKLYTRKPDDFDLLFTDIILPDGSGVDLYYSLKEINEGLKVLLCSGYSDYKIPWGPIKKRKLPFISKPFRLYELFKTIKLVLQSQ